MKRILITVLSCCSFLFAEGFTLSSKDISGQLSMEQVFNGFGCTGKNISPELSWKNAPEGTKSYAITVYDKDAPTGSGWWHWVVIDIPSDVKKLAKNSGTVGSKLLPKGALQIRSDYGSLAFGGACPPVGDIAHQYVFTVHALDVEKLGIDDSVSPAIAGYMINSHTIGRASVIAHYGR